MSRFAIALLACAFLFSFSSSGCSSKGVELNKESSKTFDPKTDEPISVGGPGGGGGSAGINKGKKTNLK